MTTPCPTVSFPQNHVVSRPASGGSVAWHEFVAGVGVAEPRVGMIWNPREGGPWSKSYKWSYFTLINGRKSRDNWGYNPAWVLKLHILFMFIPKIGEMIQFDSYFSDGWVQPPTIGVWYIPRFQMGPLVLVEVRALFWRLDLQKLRSVGF